MTRLTITATLLLVAFIAQAQSETSKFRPVFSLGTRNTVSSFNSDDAIGLGIGGQSRLQISKRLNTEWYLDYITSKTSATARNDYHIGWSLMYYFNKNNDFESFLKPYLIAGHCFDKTQVFEIGNRSNSASRLSMATQAGLGTHLNITPKFDCSLSGQYMLHFGKDIETERVNGALVIAQADHTHVDGHLLFTLSFNYKLFQL